MIDSAKLQQLATSAQGFTECYIVGGGPSLRNFDWSVLDGKFVIAINRAYEVLPNAQIVYFTDDDWYFEHKEQLHKHSGLKVKGSLNTATLQNEEGITQFLLTGMNSLAVAPGCLSHGRNSSYAAINLAAIHLGFKKIFLLGVDMKWGKTNDSSTSHWHSGHSRVDPENAYGNMMQAYDTIVAPLRQRGVQVINVNMPDQTNLSTFPIVPHHKVFGKPCFGEDGGN